MCDHPEEARHWVLTQASSAVLLRDLVDADFAALPA